MAEPSIRELFLPRFVKQKASAVDIAAPFAVYQSPAFGFTLGRPGFDHRLGSHAIRAQHFRELFDILPEVPAWVLAEREEKGEGGLALNLSFTLAFVYLTNRSFAVAHEYGHYSAAVFAGAKNVELHLNLFDAGPGRGRVDIPADEYDRLNLNERLLIAGAGVAATAEGFTNQLEWSFLNGGRLDRTDLLFLSAGWLNSFIIDGADYDAANLEAYNEGPAFSSSTHPIRAVNFLRPAGLAAFAGTLFSTFHPDHGMELPSILPDWYSVFGPAGDYHSLSIYSRLNDRWVVAPRIRFSLEKESGAASFGAAVYYAGEKKRPKFYAGGEIWHQEALGGNGGHLKAGAILPIAGPFSLVGQIESKTGGYLPDSPTLSPHFLSTASLKLDL